MRRLVLAAVVLLVAGSSFAQEPGSEGRRPMTVDDALDMVNVGGATMSPSGDWVLYTQSELNWDDNKRDTKVYMTSSSPSAGDAAFQYVGEEGGSNFQFSPDGRYLIFRRSVGGESGGGDAERERSKQQIFWMRTAGGEAVQLTEHATSVGQYKWSHDSSTIYFAAADERDEDDQKAIEKGSDAIFVDEGPNGQTASNWSNVWSFDIGSKEEAQLTEEEFLISSFDPSPDDKWMAMTARYSNRRNDADKTEVFLLNLESKEKTRLSDNHAPENGVQWAPDSSGFLYSAADDKEWLNRNTKLWLMDAALAEHRMLSGKFEGNLSNPVWTPDGQSILFTGQQGTNSNLFRLNVDNGDLEQLTDLEGILRAMSFSADRTRFVYSFQDFDTPPDLYTAEVDNFEPVRLTDTNPQIAELQLGGMQVFRWKSHDGMEIEGLLHLPVGYEEGKSYPLMLNIHGGPAGNFPNGWRSSYHWWAGLGYVAMSANVRGSSGYTDHLREGNTVARGDGIGFGDFQDLMTGVDSLIERGIVDPERMGVRGWSYGGILGGWTITHTDRFKAASIGAGVYDWTSEYGPGFNNDVRLWHIGGTPWDNPDGYRNQSALTHAKNVTSATLLIHGIEDRTDTEQQSMMFFTALKDIGAVPVRYMKFPREPHGFREPRHQRTRDIEEIRWMQKYVLGEEWTPWERPTDEDMGEDKDEAKAAEQ